MTQFQRITKLRKQTITVDSETADRLEKFTQFVRETQGDDLTQSDIMDYSDGGTSGQGDSVS